MPADDTMPEGTDAIIEGAGVSTEDEDGFAAEDDEKSDEELTETGPAPLARGRPNPEPTSRATSSEDQAASGGAAGEPAPDLRTTVMSRIEGLSGQANDRARDFVQTAKDRTTEAIDDVVRMIEDAAGEIDAKIGTQYGDYARRAAGTVDGIAQSIRGKDVDALFADARGLITRSPAAAIGIAATLGFVAARVVRAAFPGEATAARPAA